MSQCATLYRISKEDFDIIAGQQDATGYLDIENNYETFAGTHEGLKFLLSKFGEIELIDQVFYPKVFIGKEVDYKNMDDEAIESLSRRIYYLSPGLIAEIDKLLSRLDVTDFRKCFDPDELNKEDIYPWCWNNNKEPDAAYNEKHIIDDLVRLKSLFEKAASNREYILSYVG